MSLLTTKQKQFLKGLAHDLSPIVRIGKAGITPPVVGETRKSLQAHELIKVRIEADEGSERRELARRLAAEAGAEVVGTIGKIAILYREREEKPEIRLPK